MQTFARRLSKMVRKFLEIYIILSKQVNLCTQFQSYKIRTHSKAKS